MDVDETDPAAHQRVTIEEAEHLGMSRHGDSGETPEQIEHLLEVPQVPARELPDHEGVHAHPAGLQLPGQPAASGAQVVDPDGRVDEDHAPRAPFPRRRGGALSDACCHAHERGRRALGITTRGRGSMLPAALGRLEWGGRNDFPARLYLTSVIFRVRDSPFASSFTK